MVSGLLVNLLAARPGISARAAAQLLIDTAVVGDICDAGPNSPNRMAFQDCTTLTGQDRATGETFVIDTRHLSGTLGGGPEGGGISTGVYIVFGAVRAAVSARLVVGLVWKCAGAGGRRK
ncbi:hypothetical protein SARC_08088 [Sphaeroforma arctica JP610]|uniref:Uncharacterized protein n=1 Tax=Sphaeroforma arctica JP610 TaxID=667725 RepID=A0A0L0FRY5_9EUKA|nr:hypothetical protein SARC_08088 [Sphaeroforma arctica JP610]KNC79520.1 hypothetical protein SARC_08088 [Sphaeroforma arctica JP610]|eukprot:XP_014153422.1 hypothetical protein SARC_08088 [Sphaeroforma arctica JP610]